MLRAFALGAVLLAMSAAGAAADYRSGIAAWGRGDSAAAAAAFRPAAEAGDADSQYMMGRLCALGGGVPQDFVQAWVWFDRAARQGYPQAADGRAMLDHVLNPQQLALARSIDAPPPLPPATTPPQVRTVVAERQVVLVPRRGVVQPARLVAPGPTEEGRLLARGEIPGQVRAEQVRMAQRTLREIGLYAGPVDGSLGPATRQAIRDYQRAVGWPADGQLTAQVMGDLTVPDQQQASR
ncbi:MAG: peptidoglycan-binding protein [Magnetospirillum sp.]|nr:peptidoglycan-binding protein [Magnetospirillum sp.]